MKRAFITITMIIGITVMITACKGSKPQTAKIKLPSNPTTGYEWQAEQGKELFEINSEYVEKETDEEAVGVGGTQIFTLKPKEKGLTKITFTYSQPWEPSEDDDRLSYELKVTDSKQIKVMSVTGGVSGTIDEVPELPEMEIE